MAENEIADVVDNGEDWVNKIPTIDFLDPKSVHDRVLLVEDKQFFVHSVFLSFHSEYFNTLFNGSFIETEKNEIELKDLSADDFQCFLKLISPARFEITKDNYRMLVSISCRFLAPGALDMCRVFIENNFDKLDKIPLIETAFEFNMKDIKEKLAQFFYDNGLPGKTFPLTSHRDEILNTTEEARSFILESVLRLR